MNLRAPLLMAVVLAAAPWACVGGGDETSDPSATGEHTATGGHTTTTDGSPTDGTGGASGSTAKIRVVNLVQGLTFDVWGADADHSPVLVAQGLGFETVSAYFDAPLNEFTMHPEFVLMPAGEVPDDVATWEVDNSSGPDRAYVIVTELDAADERATLIFTLDSFTNHVGYEQLDETELMPGDPSQVNLHISHNLFDLGGSVVPAFAIVGDPCLFTGSTGVPQAWSVAPGTFDIGIYDLQTVSDCTMQLASAPITAAAGDQVLVAVYHIDAEVKLLTAAIGP